MQAFLLVPVRPDTYHAAGVIQEHFIFRVSLGQNQGLPCGQGSHRPEALVLGTGFQSCLVLPCHLLG